MTLSGAFASFLARRKSRSREKVQRSKSPLRGSRSESPIKSARSHISANQDTNTGSPVPSARKSKPDANANLGNFVPKVVSPDIKARPCRDLGARKALTIPQVSDEGVNLGVLISAISPASEVFEVDSPWEMDSLLDEFSSLEAKLRNLAKTSPGLIGNCNKPRTKCAELVQ